MVTRRGSWADGAVPALLSAVVVASAAAGDGGTVLAGICRELLAGTTEGRQALIGSCWYGPLPTLACLPFTWLLGGAGTLALLVAAWFYWTVMLVLAGRVAGHPLARLLLQGLLVAAVAVAGAGRDPSLAFVSAVALQGVRSAIGWYASRRSRDLIQLACGLALLTACGLPLAGLTLVLSAGVPIAALGCVETRRRLPAILLLGWLPTAYVLAVWALANWLILGDPVFFLRALGGRHGLDWQGLRLEWDSMAGMLGVLACVAALAGAVARRLPTATTAAAIGLLTWFWASVLQALGVGWSAAAAHTVVVLCGALALWLSRMPDERARPPWNAWGNLVLFVLVVLLVRHRTPAATAPADRAARAILREEVAAFVEARTPYGRVFACGYEGLRLLDGYAGGRILPNLDLHIGEVRKLYFGQQLFLLVHSPVGPAAMDSVHGRHPWLYESGGSRAIYAADFGAWRLFEVVGAPTEEQLKAWRDG